MLRFNRNYEVEINDGRSVTVITPPIRIAFECAKSTFGGLNTLNMQIYNLTRTKSQAFVKDTEQQKKLTITLKVGYGEALETLFSGDVNRGFVSKQGTDIINSLQILDGGFGANYGYISQTVKTRAEINNALVSTMPTVTIGSITQQSELIRPRVLVGNCNKIFQQQLDPDQEYFIDNNQVFIMKKNEYLANYIAVVSPATGLMNTPEREFTLVSFQTMLNPVIRIGGLVDLESTTASYLNGVYRVQQIITKGDNYGNDWTQTITGQLAEGFNKL